MWDTEDAEDAASGKFPRPAQPYYCESPRFKELTQQVQNIRAILRRRSDLEGGVVDTDHKTFEPDDPSHPTNSPIYPRSRSLSIPLSHHNFSNNIIITSSPDILAPEPLPLSPNIVTVLSQQSQPHARPPQIKTPPDILAPQPLPPKPNIRRIFSAITEAVWAPETAAVQIMKCHAGINSNVNHQHFVNKLAITLILAACLHKLSPKPNQCLFYIDNCHLSTLRPSQRCLSNNPPTQQWHKSTSYWT
jgi:hypothetical protein